MAGNPVPIYSRVGAIQGGAFVNTAVGDYVGQSVNYVTVFTADANNGSYVQRLRIKGANTNVANVLRVFINNGQSELAPVVAAPASVVVTQNTGGQFTASTTATYYVKVQAVDTFGGLSALSSEASNTINGTNSAISVSWTATANAVGYNVYLGPSTGGQVIRYQTNTNLITIANVGSQVVEATGGANKLLNNYYYGEVALPAITASATAPTVEIDYPMNIALPPGYRIMVGLGTAIASSNGWYISAIGGHY